MFYESASAAWRCIDATNKSLAFETWVIMLLYSVSLVCAIIWTQFTISATALVGMNLTRKAMLKQNINPYMQM